MRNKESIDELDIDDLYNNLKCLKLTSKVPLDHLQTLIMWPFSLQKTLTVLMKLILPMVFLLQQAHNSQGQHSSNIIYVAMLSMRVKRFYKKTRRKLIFNGKEPVGYRCRDNTRRTVPVETSDALVVQDNALIVQDGLGMNKDMRFTAVKASGNPQQALKYKGMFDSGCSRHMTGNKALLTDYQDI
ncbi:hypothetical protein Tco_0601059 [Tanacetum coccineum]